MVGAKKHEAQYKEKSNFGPEGPGNATPKGKTQKSAVASKKESRPTKPKNYYGKGSPKGL
jgi:hypothetical protein